MKKKFQNKSISTSDSAAIKKAWSSAKMELVPYGIDQPIGYCGCGGCSFSAYLGC